MINIIKCNAESECIESIEYWYFWQTETLTDRQLNGQWQWWLWWCWGWIWWWWWSWWCSWLFCLQGKRYHHSIEDQWELTNSQTKLLTHHECGCSCCKASGRGPPVLQRKKARSCFDGAWQWWIDCNPKHPDCRQVLLPNGVKERHTCLRSCHCHSCKFAVTLKGREGCCHWHCFGWYGNWQGPGQNV